MLHILRNDGKAGRLVLILHGDIAGEWADMLEVECREVDRPGLAVQLDLSGVVFISRLGIEVLRLLSREGVEITGCPPLIAGLLEREGIQAGRASGDKTSGKAAGKDGGGPGSSNQGSRRPAGWGRTTS